MRTRRTCSESEELKSRLLFKSRDNRNHQSKLMLRWGWSLSRLMAAEMLMCAAIVVVFATSVRSEKNVGASAAPPCSTRTTCHECIQMRTCSWCSDPEFGEGDRCYSADSVLSAQCREEFYYNPRNSIKQNKSKGSAGVKKAVHISPQRISIQIRVGEPQTVTFNYTQPSGSNYPVDLYHVMDLTNTMADDKATLHELGNRLIDEMSKVTDNSRFGFGSFVDKTVLPFVSVAPVRLVNPCTGGTCVPTYGFRNHKSLDDDQKSFSDEVQNANVSSNLDGPEGGFDAIMQALVCKKEIGWRKDARKFLIFLSDAGFHIAGDGRLAGIVKPNDGQCHLDAAGEYTHSTLQDYPSIGQLNITVRDSAVNVIFAVTQEQMPTYKLLEDAIQGSHTVDLSEDSSNIVDLVRDQYKKITSTVQMRDNAGDYLSVTYTSSCTGGESRTTKKCEGIQMNQTVKFDATVTLVRCPEKSLNPVTFNVSPVGVGDRLVIEVAMICGCPCEDPTHKVQATSEAENCSLHGVYHCGICMCEPTHSGRHCECEKESAQTSNLASLCRPDNTTVDCYGRGVCNCGVCQCDLRPDPKEVISGKHCECDNFSCRNSCSEHGTCDCGVCSCDPHWSGVDCGCRATNDTCVSPTLGTISVCHGRGNCTCGACACDADRHDRQYRGQYCEELPNIADMCPHYKDFVDCSLHETPEEPANCTRNSIFTFQLVDDVEADEANNVHLCEHTDREQCRFSYVYRYDDLEGILVQAKRDVLCPQPYILSGYAGLTVAVVVVMAVLAAFVLWKIVTHYRDNKEYARFEKQKLMSQWGKEENPLFLDPVSKFNNPTYENAKQD